MREKVQKLGAKIMKIWYGKLFAANINDKCDEKYGENYDDK